MGIGARCLSSVTRRLSVSCILRRKTRRANRTAPFRRRGRTMRKSRARPRRARPSRSSRTWGCAVGARTTPTAYSSKSWVITKNHKTFTQVNTKHKISQKKVTWKLLWFFFVGYAMVEMVARFDVSREIAGNSERNKHLLSIATEFHRWKKKSENNSENKIRKQSEKIFFSDLFSKILVIAGASRLSSCCCAGPCACCS